MLVKLKIVATFVLILISVGTATSLYVSYLNHKISALTVERDAAVQEAKTEAELRKFSDTQNELASERILHLQELQAKSQEEVTSLRAKFDKHDFAKLVQKKPKMMQRRMQDGTADILRELEEITR